VLEGHGDELLEPGGGVSPGPAFVEKSVEPGGASAVEDEKASELLMVGVIVGKTASDVAGEVGVPGGNVGDEGVDGPAFGRDVGPGVEAVGTGVLVAPGRANAALPAPVGGTAGRIGAADGIGPTGRAVGTSGGAADGLVIVSFIHGASLVDLFLSMPIILPFW
jgi:hypothetical protein